MKSKDLGPKNFCALRKPGMFLMHILFFKLILGKMGDVRGREEEGPDDEYNVRWSF